MYCLSLYIPIESVIVYYVGHFILSVHFGLYINK